MIKIYRNTSYPKRSVDLSGNQEEFSVTVFAATNTGETMIAWWNYDTKDWMAKSDDVQMYHTNGEGLKQVIDFVWMYKPDELKFS